MADAEAALTPRQRLRIARLAVDDGWPVAHAAAFLYIAWPTAKRWAESYRAMGADGMGDRFSRPHRFWNRAHPRLVRKIVTLRWHQLLGSVAIGAAPGMLAPTVQAVPVRAKVNRLHHIDIRTGELVRRSEHDKPGELIHVDVKTAQHTKTVVAGAASDAPRTATTGKSHRGPDGRLITSHCWARRSCTSWSMTIP